MIRVMLVDDEPFIRVAIKSLFSWENHGFLITSEANNGKEALNKLKCENIDLLITDIKMPVTDGIALIRQVKKLYPHIYCVVLSNYGDFNLTRQAFIEGAVDYLLKGSLNEESFSSLIERLRKNCFQEYSEAEGYKAEPSSVPRREFEDKIFALRHLISGGRNTEADRHMTEILDIGMPFVITSLRLLPRNIESLAASSANTEMIKNTVFRIISEISEFQLYYYAVSIREYILIIYDKQGDAHSFVRRLKTFFSQLDSNIGVYLNSFTVTGTSLIRRELLQVSTSYEEADALSSKIFYSTGSGQYFQSDEKEKVPGKNEIKNYVLSCIENIPFLVREQNVNSLYSLFSGLIALLRKYSYPPTQGKRLVFNLEFLTLSEISRSSAENPGFFFDNEMIYDSTMHSLHIVFLEQTVEGLFKDLREASSGLSFLSSGCPDIVRQAVDFMKEHYRDPETNLSAVARAISVNPSYLSRIFHKETGQTFNSYLNFLRIGYAKHLLMTTQESISAVSEKSGYGNPKYFINLFKKTAGLSPSAYRNSQKHSQPSNGENL